MTDQQGVWAANRLGLDYVAEAGKLGAPVVPIIDAHSHINGVRAAEIYGEVRELYGVRHTLSMSQIGQAAEVRRVLGDSIEFIAVPSYMDEDRDHAMRGGFLENLRRWHGEFGSRIVKFWVSPRARDMAGDGGGDIAVIDGAWKIKIAEEAMRLGMMFMVHIADPDTWFEAKYTDVSRYGTKASQYEGLERMLERFPVRWIAAHMGGWPEDLDFLDGLLSRHENLVLDTSATKWIVRAVSAHDRDRVVRFFERWSGRLLFGSDIVTTDEHLKPDDDSSMFGKGASSEAEAFELYASRYWALRTLWETGYEGESPIADPDLAMVEPDRYGPMDAPVLRGKGLPDPVLRELYAGAAEGVVGEGTKARGHEGT